MELYYFLVLILLCLIIALMMWKIKILSKKESFPKKEETMASYPQIITPENFETILKSISDGIIILDPRGIILFANRSFKEFIKIEDTPEGKHFMEVIRNIDLLNLLRAAMIKMEEVKEEFIIRKGGEEIFIFAKAMPVIGQDGIIKFLIVFLNNITKLKKLETVRRDFVANVSHELKTPVTAIKGYAETLLDGAIEDRENAKKFLEIIKNQSDRLNALVDDLLMLSRIEFGDIKIEKENISLDEIINSVFQIFKDKAEKKSISLKKDIPENAFIYADKNRILQIMINLVDNAIKFTEKGFVMVRFYKKNSSQVLSVEDTGIGIPKEHLHRIGERFYRVDRARSRQLGGTGLGLAIVKHLILAHGWQLNIESEVNRGTKVNIIIPEG
ncbi:MAG: ATP-binding protein [Thermodesulfovibrio sp.]|nr:ATP-binding protein [Thermodesulfovibrio sp.]MDW7999044.1 ATP-binding protein [Thermodesulfovibrio sp.]